jgi:hypothetical protein
MSIRLDNSLLKKGITTTDETSLGLMRLLKYFQQLVVGNIFQMSFCEASLTEGLLSFNRMTTLIFDQQPLKTSEANSLELM